MSRLKAANNAQTALAALMDASATSCTVVNGDILPAVPFRASIDNEIIEVGAKSGNALSSILRGQEGTTAAAHQSGSLVEGEMTAGMHNELMSTSEMIKDNFAATTAPGVGDDSGDGYAVGSRWIDTTNDTLYVCLDATAGAAIWFCLTGISARTASTLARRDASGNVAVNGIAFPATQSANADPNTLDDYEEGTWTASFRCGTSGTITINNSFKTGAYTKVGRLVTVTGLFGVSSVSSPVGTLFIDGLPFPCATGSQFSGGVNILATGLGATVNAIMARVQASTSSIDVYSFAAGSMADMAAQVSASSFFFISATYFV